MTEVGVVLLLVVPEALGMDGLTETGKAAIRPVFIKSEKTERERERGGGRGNDMESEVQFCLS